MNQHKVQSITIRFPHKLADYSIRIVLWLMWLGVRRSWWTRLAQPAGLTITNFYDQKRLMIYD